MLQAAILNANYIAAKLKGHFNILYTGKTGFVCSELIIDCREFKKKLEYRLKILLND